MTMIEDMVENVVEKKSNLLKDTHPHLLEEWDYEKNSELGIDIDKITYGNGKMVGWVCPKCKSQYNSTTNNRTMGKNCPYCAGRRVNNTNSLSTLRPDLIREWDIEKNDSFTVHDVTCGSHKKVWWRCIKCKSSYNMTVKSKTTHSQGCPYCTGKKTNHTNSFASLNPNLSLEWHPTKNGDLTPHDVTCGSDKKVWWLGNCGHEWDMRVVDRTHGQKCPYCSSSPKRVLVEYNDMWTTNPELASLLANPEDGYKYMQGSSQKTDWKCQRCACIVKNKAIHVIKDNGVSCPKCGDGISFGEKMLYGLLDILLEDFVVEKVFDWLSDKRYDFYFEHEDMKIVVEVHGMQHFKYGFQSYGGKSLEEVQKNDKYKYKMAIKNGIDKYIIIDARHSDFVFIKNDILHSELNNIFNLKNIDWSKVYTYSKTSNIYVCAQLWNDGLATSQIAEKVRYSGSSVNKNLKKAVAMGLCDYDPKIKRTPPNTKLNKPIIQLTLDGEFVKKWDSIKEAGMSFGDKRGNSIGKVLAKTYKQMYGYKWVYLKDYE